MSSFHEFLSFWHNQLVLVECANLKSAAFHYLGCVAGSYRYWMWRLLFNSWRFSWFPFICAEVVLRSETSSSAPGNFVVVLNCTLLKASLFPCSLKYFGCYVVSTSCFLRYKFKITVTISECMIPGTSSSLLVKHVSFVFRFVGARSKQYNSAQYYFHFSAIFVALFNILRSLSSTVHDWT